MKWRCFWTLDFVTQKEDQNDTWSLWWTVLLSFVFSEVIFRFCFWQNSSTSSADQDIPPLDINATALLSEDGMELVIQYLQGRKFEDKIKAPKSTADVKLKEHGSGDDIEKNGSTSSADQDIPP